MEKAKNKKLNEKWGIHICSWLTFGSRIRRSKLWFSLLFNAWASRRRRARSTRANVGLSIIDGARLWSPELGSMVTNIVTHTVYYYVISLVILSLSLSIYHSPKVWNSTKTRVKKNNIYISLIPVFPSPMINFLRSLLLVSFSSSSSVVFISLFFFFTSINVHDTRTHTHRHTQKQKQKQKKNAEQQCQDLCTSADDYHMWQVRWIVTSLSNVIEF